MKSRRIEEFENFEMEPSAEVWKNIEDALPQQKKRRKFLFWLFPFVLILAGTILISNQSIKFFRTNKFFELPLHTDNNSSQNIFNIKKISGEHNIANQKTKQFYSGEKKLVNENGLENILKHEKTESSNKELLASLTHIEFIPSAIENENSILRKEYSETKKHQLSRWSFLLSFGSTISETQKTITAANESADKNVKSIQELFLSAGVRYDASPRIKLSAGISLLTIGQETSDSMVIINDGNSGDPENTYSFNTPLETVTGLASDFNLAFFGNPDSSLYLPNNAVGPVTQPTPVKKVYLNLKQEFKYVDVHVTVVYKPVEGRITPYAGIFFSASYLMRDEIYLNGERLHYQYKNKPSDLLFSAGITAGFDVFVNRHLYFTVNGFYKKAISAVFSSGDSWKPYMTGLGGGIGYRLNKK